MSASEIYANARALGPYLRDKAAEIDEARRLPKEVAARLRDAETWCQHVVVQRKMLEAIGGMLLGADDLPWHPFL